MNSCPPEVVHVICSLLLPKDVANFRLVSKDLAVIGGHYLIDRIRFNASTSSVERLIGLSNHATFRQSVEILYWESAQLAYEISIDGVREVMQSTQVKEPEPSRPPDDANSREMRLYDRNVRKWKDSPQTVSESAVKLQFEKYEMELLAEDEAEELLLFGNALTTAVCNLSHLKEIRFDNAPKCRHMLSQRFLERFSDWKVPPPFDIDTGNSVYQFRWLLEAIARAPIKLERLYVRYLAPAFFEHPTEPPASASTMHNAMRNLKDISMHLRINEDHEHVDGGCFGILNRGGLRSMLSAAPLKKLSITFDKSPEGYRAPDLTNVLGVYAWPNLQSIRLSEMSTTEEDFMACLARQKQLRELDFGSICLEKGSWEHVVERMQKELSLDSMELFGVLVGNDPEYEEFWDMDALEIPHHSDAETESWSSDMDASSITLKMEIETYVLYGDEHDPNPFSIRDWSSILM